jgi:uncharacterized protein (TIGR02598 family)
MNKEHAGLVRRGPHRNAFSLVEIVIALGVASAALVAIVALLPVCLQSSRDTLDETKALDLLSHIVADRQSSPFNQPSTFYLLPALSGMTAKSTAWFGIDDDNRSTASVLTHAHYRVDYTITPPTPGCLTPYQAYFKIRWPARASKMDGALEAVATFPQP